MQNRPGNVADTARLGSARPADKGPKTRLLTREALDGRTRARKQFDAIATVQRHLVEAFAGAAICVHDLNARLLLGQKVDILELSTAISTMVRIASRVGVNRVATDITPPPVDDYAAHINEAAE